MQTICLLLFFCFLLEEVRLFPHNHADDDLVVKLNTPNGTIKGHVLQSSSGNDFYAFQEIPFAVPPVGENRLQDPKPAKGWEGILETTKNTKICPQFMSGIFPDYNYTETEDCLYLNVYTPVKPNSNNTSLPVYIWIYGGAFYLGDATNTSFNPAWLIEYDIVIVTVNYRLGALGFLTTDDVNLPGNLGLKDQQLAMQWVSQNIQLFGGNPEKLTLGGESAGGISVSYQLLARKNEGLLSGVIPQSGSALMSVPYIPNYRDFAFQLGKLLNSSFDSTDSEKLRQVLLNATVDEIKAAQLKVITNSTNGVMNELIWAPIIEDGSNENALITGSMLQDFIDGNFNQVPSLIGFTSEETLFFIQEVTEGIKARAKEYDDDPSLIITSKMNVSDRISAGKELKALYTNSTFEQDIGAFIRFGSELSFVTPVVQQAKLCSKYAPVYVYEFAYSDTRSNIPGTENVPHADEVRYFWGSNNQTVSNRTIQDQLLTLWTNFIRYQNPTPETNNLIPVIWPKIGDGDIVYLNINETLEIRTNPKQSKEFSEVLDKYIVKPYIIY